MHPICVMLQEALKGLVESKYGGNIRKAAKYLEIDYYLAYRLFHGQQKNVAFFEALRLVKILNVSVDGSVLREFYPKEFEDASSIGGDQSSIDAIFEALDWVLSRPLHYEVLIYCSEMRGVTEPSVSKEYGSRGALALKDLIQKKLVKMGDVGVLSSLMSKNHWSPHSICLKHANANISLLRLDRPGSFIRNQAIALNDKGVVAYYKAYRGFEEAAEAIEKDQQYAGNELVVSGMYLGPILETNRMEEV